ncbi:von Willebrand factor A domain-containing protein 2 [Octopus bimaculoides]|nr:von Willebrand factor A domain-containing protein 2 [Octopus bimaculoides]|eukprot:XP_014768752.1 PREDICTED: von Willebrand factor A domain-containing protein 2-like [Octopus bimaculoides]
MFCLLHLAPLTALLVSSKAESTMRNIVMLAALLASVAAYDRTDASKCTKDKADIFFLLDSSDSTSQLFAKQKIFVNKVLDSLEVEYGKVHIGIATFSDSFFLNVDLTYDVSYLKMYLGHIYPMGGSTKIGSALKSLQADGFGSHRARRTATKIAIVLTDGQSSDDPIAAAKTLMAKNVKVFAVGDTYMNNQADLRMIASRPTSYYVFNLDSHDLIGSIKNAVQCVSPKTDCSVLHNINLQFLIDTPSYSQKTSLKLINFVAETSAMLKETNAEFALGVNFGVMGHQDIAPNYHTQLALKNISSFRFYKQVGMIDSFLSFLAKGRLDRNQRTLLIIFIDESAEPLKELRDKIERLKLKYRGLFSFFIITFGPSVNRHVARSMASNLSFYFHIPDVRYMEVSHEDFVKLLCGSSASYYNKNFK